MAKDGYLVRQKDRRTPVSKIFGKYIKKADECFSQSDLDVYILQSEPRKPKARNINELLDEFPGIDKFEITDYTIPILNKTIRKKQASYNYFEIFKVQLFRNKKDSRKYLGFYLEPNEEGNIITYYETNDEEIVDRLSRFFRSNKMERKKKIKN